MRALRLVPLAALVAILALFAVGLARDPSSMPSELIDRPLPSFALPPIAGREQGLSAADLKGQVALVNVFASWCPSCVYEHPLLMRLKREGRPVVYGLAWKDAPADTARWLAERGDPYAGIGADIDGRVAIELGVTGAPETFVIDKEGRIRHKHIGPVSEDVWAVTLAPLVARLEAE